MRWRVEPRAAPKAKLTSPRAPSPGKRLKKRIVSHSRTLAAPSAMTYRLRFLLGAATLGAIPVLVAACNPQVSTVLASDDSGTSDDGNVVPASCTDDNSCYENPAISSPRGRCVSGKCVCEPGIAMTASGKCGDPIPTGKDAGPDVPVPECTTKGGTCTAVGDSAPPNMRPAKPGEAECANGGTCWFPVGGAVPVCYNDQGCNPSPNISALYGKCTYGLCHCNEGYTVQPNGKCNTAPPPTCAIQGGTCRGNNCAAGELMSANVTNATCPDDIETFCCNAAAACTGGGQEAAGAGWVKIDFDCCSKSTGQRPPICVNGWQTCPAGTSAVPKGSICN